jgi:hypothetical protein
MIAVCKNAESYARKLEAKLSTVSVLTALAVTLFSILLCQYNQCKARYTYCYLQLTPCIYKIIVGIDCGASLLRSVLRVHGATAIKLHNICCMCGTGAERSAYDRKPQGHTLRSQVCFTIAYFSVLVITGAA